MQFDEKKNRIIVSIDGKEIEIAPQDIRNLLPFKDADERVKDLTMIIHDLEREELTQIETFIHLCKEIDKTIKGLEEGLGKCEDTKCIRKYEAFIKIHLARKSTLTQVRLAIALLDKKKRGLRVRIARLETSGEE